MKNQRIHFQLTNPCDENWENMTPNERGRFCHVCEKQVIDFATMSDAEVIAFWENPESRKFTCGQFTEKQLTEGIEIPNSFPSWRKIASITILGLSMSGLPIELKAQREENIVISSMQSHTFSSDTITIVGQKIKPIYQGGAIAKIIKYEISDIQTALSEKGYYKGEINNIWDKKTQKAVKRFKKDNRLPKNSTICRNTLALLEL